MSRTEDKTYDLLKRVEQGGFKTRPKQQIIGKPLTPAGAYSRKRKDAALYGADPDSIAGFFEAVSDIWGERQQNVTDSYGRYGNYLDEIQVAKDYPELFSTPNRPAMSDTERGTLASSMLATGGNAVGAAGDIAFMALPFDEEIAAVAEAGLSTLGRIPVGDSTLGDKTANFYNDLNEKYPRGVEDAGNFANIATAGLAGNLLKRADADSPATIESTRGLSLAGLPNWIPNFYNTNPKEGAQQLIKYVNKLNKTEVKLKDKELSEGLDKVFVSLIRGDVDKDYPERIEEALSNLPPNKLDAEGGVPSLNLNKKQLEELVTKTYSKIQAGNLYIKLAEKYVNAKSKTKEGSKGRQEEIFKASKRIEGLVDWAGGVPFSILEGFLSPKARALYGEQGISPKAQSNITNALIAFDKGDSKALEQAVGQFIYSGNHIPNQAGRVGGENPVIDRLKNASFVGEPNIPWSEASFVNQVSKLSTISTDPIKKTRRKVPTSTKDLKHAFKLINSIWAGAGTPINKTARVVVKRPTGLSGDHKGDLARKFPASGSIRNSILDLQMKGKVTVKDLYNDLVKRQANIKGKEKPWSIVNKDWEDVEKNGLWVQAGFAGGAVTEGGVNGLMKVLPNGRLQAYMSDLHNFGEKIPVLSMYMQKTIPNDMVAVTRVDLDLLGTKDVDKARRKRGLPEDDNRPVLSGASDNKASVARSDLEEFASATPSRKALLAEQKRLLGRGLLTGQVVNTGDEDGYFRSAP